ncbi:MAG TPA: site-specific integrase [Terrimicrobiaceae bacterium]
MCYSYAMQRNDAPQSKKGHAARFLPVFDSRKRKIRGLWQRGSRYYAQLRMEMGNGESKPRRIPLEAATLDQARAELEKTRTRNREGKLPSTGHRPMFSDFAGDYLASPIHAQKKQSTRNSERVILEYWKAHLGGIRLDKITDVMVKGYREKRLAQGVTARTVNKETVAFYQVLKLANDRGLISSLPRVRQLKQKQPPKRPLLASEDVERLLSNCKSAVTKNADLLRFYLRFLALTGAREKEALRIRWADVDFEKSFVTIGADADTKNARHRTVNFTAELRPLLREMIAARPPDSSFLFPSPQRGPRDIAAHSLRESFKLVRSKAKMPQAGFHDFRHFFASQCVMAGVDFMTVAHWLGHQDGGVLVGKVYGHLADEHKRRMADNLSILKVPTNVVEIQEGAA